MTTMLVYLQQNDGELHGASLAAITAAEQLKSEWGAESFLAVIVGAGSEAAAGKAAEYGFDRVLFVDEDEVEQYRPETFAHAVVTVVDDEDVDYLVVPATAAGKDFTPRVTVAMEAGQASDITAVLEGGLLRRPMYAGNAIADVELTTDKRVVTVRATGFDAAESKGSSAEVEAASVDFDGVPLSEIVSLDLVESERPELGDASVVVSGGRALQSEENFEKYIYPLADALGAAIGASRAAVDSGYAPNDWQVGQTGKVVAPELYIAVGISGAIQHLAGMKDSKVIVAINKDGDAPIFEIADYGLVADLYETIGPLTEKIKEIKG